MGSELGISPYLDASDMANMAVPDRLSILTYVSQFYKVFRDQKRVFKFFNHFLTIKNYFLSIVFL